MTPGAALGTVARMQDSGLSTASLILGALLGFPLGFATAVMKRANKDYKVTKASVPGLRRSFWTSFRQVVKWGTVCIAIVGLLVVWVVRDVRDEPADTRPAGSPTAKVTPARQ